MGINYKLIDRQLWKGGKIIANGVPHCINTVDHALQWVEDKGRNGYEELMALVEQYREQADNTRDKDLRKSYLELAHEALERAEDEL